MQEISEDFPSAISANPEQFVGDPNKLPLSRPGICFCFLRSNIFCLACIGEFSLDQSRRQLLGRSKARYFHEAAVGRKMSVNLVQNIGSFVEKGKECDEGKLTMSCCKNLSAQKSLLFL